MVDFDTFNTCLEKCLDRQGVPIRVDNHEWPIDAILFAPSHERGHLYRYARGELCQVILNRPILVVCSTLGNSLCARTQSSVSLWFPQMHIPEQYIRDLEQW